MVTSYINQIEGKTTWPLPSLLLDVSQTYGKWLKEEERVHVGCGSSSFISALLFVPVISVAHYGPSEPLVPPEAP